jgi:PQQ-like domain
MKITTTIWLFTFLMVFGFCQAQTEPQPLWQQTFKPIADDPYVNQRTFDNIFYGNSVLLYLQNNQLSSIDIKTGKPMWAVEYPLLQSRDYTNLPANGSGLLFIPKGNTLQALDEHTGQVVWVYTSEEGLDEVVEETFNKVGIQYSDGYVLTQTKSYLTFLNALTGEVLWQQPKEGRKAMNIQLLNEDYFLMTTEAILDANVGHRPFEINSQQGIYEIKTGEQLWVKNGGTEAVYSKAVHSNNKTIDFLTINGGSYPNFLSRNVLRTGESVSDCVVSTFVTFLGLENKKEDVLGGPIARHSVDDYQMDGNWLYLMAYPNGIHRFPFCTGETLFPPQSPEAISETLDRYLHPSLVYYDITPFSWIAGPTNGNFLFQKDEQLYKVPVPQDSFTYLYHNKTDDSVYIEPKFADIDPPPYELIPSIEGKVVKVELMDNRVYVLLDNGILQVINFVSLETVLKAQTNLDTTVLTDMAFYQQNDVLIVESSSSVSRDLLAYQL